MESTQSTLVFKPREYSFIESILTDKPLTDQPPEIVQPSSVNISTVLNESIDDVMVKKALDENKPKFNIWGLSRMPLKYKMIEAIRRGEYALAETYLYDKKKAVIAWPVTVLVGALAIRTLISINPIQNKFDLRYDLNLSKYNAPNIGYFYEKMANKWFKFPVFVYSKQTNQVNGALFFQLFGENINDPLFGLYREQQFQLRFDEPQSNKIKRIRKGESIKNLKNFMSPPPKDYYNIETLLNKR